MIKRIDSVLVKAGKRRVFRTAGLYAVAAAGIWGAAEVAVDALGLPPQALTFVVIASIAGFPLALVLSWFFQVEPEGEGPSPESGITKPRAVALGLTVAIMAFAALAGSMAMGGGNGSEGAGAPAFERTRMTFLGNAVDPVISPDGRWVAFRASFGTPTEEDPLTDSLMVMVPGELEPRALAAMPSGAGPALTLVRWKADGSEIWYVVQDPDLSIHWRAVPLEGGPSREVFQDAWDLTFCPDGGRIAFGAFPAERPAVRIRDLATGEERTIELDHPGFFPLLVDWSPLGDRIPVLLVRIEGGAYSIWSVPADGSGEFHQLAHVTDLPLESGIQWSRGGESLFYDRGGRLWRVDVDPMSGAVPRSELVRDRDPSLHHNGSKEHRGAGP